MCILTATQLGCGCILPNAGGECEYALENGILPTDCPDRTVKYEDNKSWCADCLNHQQQNQDGKESDVKAEKGVEGPLHDEKISSTATLLAGENGGEDAEGGDEELDLRTEKRQLLSVEAEEMESDSEEAGVEKDEDEDEVETETEKRNREYMERDINRERETAEERSARIERERVEEEAWAVQG
jgi:hypothetical protein